MAHKSFIRSITILSL